ncbi:TPA: hypothetical protein I7759_14565 [Vibrio vulnificus]|nr:hypothetical protein [Vibrio vulnificus]
MRSTIEKETRKLQSRTLELERRRFNWRNIAKPKIVSSCEEFIEQVRYSDYPFRLFWKQGSKTENYETIQLTACSNEIGITEVHTEITQGGQVTTTEKRHEESGASLVFSQAVNGSISVMIYPYKSDLHGRVEDNIVLHHSLNPDNITRSLIKRSIKYFLMYCRCTSIYGLGCKPSLIESIKLSWLTFKDIRNKSKLMESIVKMHNNWGQLLVAAVLAFIVGYVTKT